MASRPASTDGTPPDQPVMRVPAVRRMVHAFGVSALGSAMAAVAMAYVAYRESKSVVLTVLVVGANAAPAILLSPIVGKLATRRDPRTVEIAGLVSKAALSVLLAIIAASDGLTYMALLGINVANGAVSALTAPAWPQLSRMIAPRGRLAEVGASFSSLGSLAAIAGALSGGIVVAAAGSAIVFVLNALSYVPLVLAVHRVPGDPPERAPTHRAVRDGVRTVRRVDKLRDAVLVAAALNLVAWPLLSMLPAVAQDIDARAHVLGLLVGAFYAGAAAVTWVVRRLRRRYPYGRILFVGFLGAGVLIFGHALLTEWRAPGYDAVVVAVLTLAPIGLAMALDSALLQALVQMSTTDEEQAPVLVVYATITTVVTPVGGLILGALADTLALWGAVAIAGASLAVVALALRKRLRVFDELGELPAPVHGHHLHLVHLMGWDVARGALLTHHDPATESERQSERAAAREPTPVG